MGLGLSSNLLGHPVVKSQIILNAIMKLIFHLPYRSHNSNCKLGNTVHCENDMSHFHDMTWIKKHLIQFFQIHLSAKVNCEKLDFVSSLFKIEKLSLSLRHVNILCYFSRSISLKNFVSKLPKLSHIFCVQLSTK